MCNIMTFSYSDYIIEISDTIPCFKSTKFQYDPGNYVLLRHGNSYFCLFVHNSDVAYEHIIYESRLEEFRPKEDLR